MSVSPAGLQQYTKYFYLLAQQVINQPRATRNVIFLVIFSDLFLVTKYSKYQIVKILKNNTIFFIHLNFCIKISSCSLGLMIFTNRSISQVVSEMDTFTLISLIRDFINQPKSRAATETALAVCSLHGETIDF